MLKRLWRWLLRLVVSVLVVLAIILVSDFVSHRYRPGTVLVLELNGPVPERGSVSLLGVLNTHEAALNLARRALINAKDDPRIVGLAIKVIDPEMEFAQAQELCDLIGDFKKHGKWTSAYIETAGESGSGNLPYLVASTADEVSMMPQGEMNLLGVGVREMFARGMFDWLKVKPNFDAIGQYKSAANVFTQKDFTPAQRREDDALVGDIFDQIVAQTAAHRHLAPDGIRGLIDRAPLTAADGLKARLLDRLEYEDQFDDRIKHYRGEHHEVVGFQSYAREKVLPLHAPGDKIAVIYGLGAIQRGGGGFDPLLSPDSNAMGSDDITKALKDAREDSRVRAVVFRVNSPGGSVIASELIRHEVELTAAKKPVVVSMSGTPRLAVTGSRPPLRASMRSRAPSPGRSAYSAASSTSRERLLRSASTPVWSRAAPTRACSTRSPTLRRNRHRFSAIRSSATPTNISSKLLQRTAA